MNKQRGVSLIGLLIVSAVLVFFAIMGFKLLPSYIEYFTVKRIVSDIARSPDVRGGTIRDVQNAFDRRTSIDNVTKVLFEAVAVVAVAASAPAVGATPPRRSPPGSPSTTPLPPSAVSPCTTST